MDCVLENSLLLFSCPHCNDSIQVAIADLNCKIFHHGFYVEKCGEKIINLLNQIPPHEKKEVCEELAKKNNIIGCCKPFQIILNDNKYKVEKCDYI